MVSEIFKLARIAHGVLLGLSTHCEVVDVHIGQRSVDNVNAAQGCELFLGAAVAVEERRYPVIPQLGAELWQ